MSTFLLFDLESHLLEKIINKCEKKSYVRLQQTCHDMHDFIRNSPNISVCTGGDFTLTFPNGEPHIRLSFEPWTPLNFDSFYGTRVGRLSIDKCIEFENVLDSLKKNKLTCTDLGLWMKTGTKEQTSACVKFVKPKEVAIRSEGSDRYEGLLTIKTLKEVFVCFESEDVPTALPKLLSTFSSVRIVASQVPIRVNWLHTVLRILQSQPLTYDKLDIDVTFEDGDPDWSADFIENEFGDFLVDVEEIFEGCEEESDDEEGIPVIQAWLMLSHDYHDEFHRSVSFSFSEGGNHFSIFIQGPGYRFERRLL